MKGKNSVSSVDYLPANTDCSTKIKGFIKFSDQLKRKVLYNNSNTPHEARFEPFVDNPDILSSHK